MVDITHQSIQDILSVVRDNVDSLDLHKPNIAQKSLLLGGVFKMFRTD